MLFLQDKLKNYFFKTLHSQYKILVHGQEFSEVVLRSNKNPFSFCCTFLHISWKKSLNYELDYDPLNNCEKEKTRLLRDFKNGWCISESCGRLTSRLIPCNNSVVVHLRRWILFSDLNSTYNDLLSHFRKCTTKIRPL